MEKPILLDTNALLFFLYEDALSPRANEVVQNSASVSVSVASLWEIAIKQSIGKLELKETVSEIAEACEKTDIALLPIQPDHLDYLRELPKIHGDPFDRLIIAQAVVEGMTLVTKDNTIPKYSEVMPDFQVIW